MTFLADYARLMRVRQWYKNALVFVALVFSGQLFDVQAIGLSLVAFLSLSLISSTNYIINDVLDANRDRLHPEKKNRPVSSGRVSRNSALALALLLLIIGAYLAFYLGTTFFALALLLFLGGQAYSLFFRHYAFADIVMLSCFFVLRAMGGAAAVSVELSPWLFLGSFVLATFLVVLKRKADLELLNKAARDHRRSFQVYSAEIIHALSIVALTLVLVSYSAYSFLSSKHTLFFLLTIPLAFYASFRYFALSTIRPVICRHPERFYRDLPLLASVILWSAIVVADVYLLGGAR